MAYAALTPIIASMQPRYTPSMLLSSAQAGTWQHVMQMIAHNDRLPLDAQDPMTGRTVLHEAVRAGVLEVAGQLLEAGAAVDLQDGSYRTPLYEAALIGDLAALKLLVAHGADTLATSSDKTPLEAAAGKGHQEAFHYLYHAEAEQRGAYILHGKALAMAAAGGHLPIVEDLLARETDALKTAQGVGALAAAAASGHLPVMAALFEAGAALNACCAKGLTPLIAAARHHHFKASLWLLAHGAHVATQSKTGQSVLHAAAATLSKEVNTRQQSALIETLLAHGADPHLQDRCGRTPLHVAAELGSLAATQILVRAGSDLSARDDAGKTPLALAEPYRIMGGERSAVAQYLSSKALEPAQQQKNRNSQLSLCM